MKQNGDERNSYLCGTAYRKLLYSGYKPTIPKEMTEPKPRIIIKKWLNGK